MISYEYGHTKLVPIIACALAGVVTTSRFTAQQHYASDLVAGGAMGWFIGRYVYETHMSHLAHKHSSLVPLLVPQVQVATRSYGVMLLFGDWSRSRD